MVISLSRCVSSPTRRAGARSFDSPVQDFFLAASRSRRLPSCMAWTRATGIVCPSSIRPGSIRLRRGQVFGPRIAVAEQAGRVAHGEVARRHAVDLVPGQRERHRRAGPHARAVRGDHGGPAGPRGVQEDLPAAVLLDVRGGGEHRVDPLGPRRDGAGRGRDVLRLLRQRWARTRAHPSTRWSSPHRPCRRRRAPAAPGGRRRRRERRSRSPPADRGRGSGTSGAASHRRA